jgi:16S rRNA (cytidine1402-2'-O)-methyltransferase
VDLIASEDTRTTGRLLQHFAIKKLQVSFHEHNEQRAGERILALLKQGKSVALVTNAGTPGIADPGFTLVRRALEAGVDVTMIPGPTAFAMALVLSGLPVHGFTFRGFPPRRPGPRRRFLEVDQNSPHTLIFYESPYRLKEFLQAALEVFGDRPAALTNELTKMFESVHRGTLSQLLSLLEQEEPRGEYTVVIAGSASEMRNAKCEMRIGRTPDPDNPKSEIRNPKSEI